MVTHQHHDVRSMKAGAGSLAVLPDWDDAGVQGGIRSGWARRSSTGLPWQAAGLRDNHDAMDNDDTWSNGSWEAPLRALKASELAPPSRDSRVQPVKHAPVQPPELAGRTLLWRTQSRLVNVSVGPGAPVRGHAVEPVSQPPRRESQAHVKDVPHWTLDEFRAGLARSLGMLPRPLGWSRASDGADGTPPPVKPPLPSPASSLASSTQAPPLPASLPESRAGSSSSSSGVFAGAALPIGSPSAVVGATSPWQSAAPDLGSPTPESMRTVADVLDWASARVSDARRWAEMAVAQAEARQAPSPRPGALRSLPAAASNTDQTGTLGSLVTHDEAARDSKPTIGGSHWNTVEVAELPTGTDQLTHARPVAVSRRRQSPHDNPEERHDDDDSDSLCSRCAVHMHALTRALEERLTAASQRHRDEITELQAAHVQELSRLRRAYTEDIVRLRATLQSALSVHSSRAAAAGNISSAPPNASRIASGVVPPPPPGVGRRRHESLADESGPSRPVTARMDLPHVNGSDITRIGVPDPDDDDDVLHADDEAAAVIDAPGTTAQSPGLRHSPESISSSSQAGEPRNLVLEVMDPLALDLSTIVEESHVSASGSTELPPDGAEAGGESPIAARIGDLRRRLGL